MRRINGSAELPPFLLGLSLVQFSGFLALLDSQHALVFHGKHGHKDQDFRLRVRVCPFKHLDDFLRQRIAGGKVLRSHNYTSRV